MTRDECPECGANLEGEPIPQEYLDRGFYTGTHFSRAIGVQQPGIYDGILFWRCPDCGYAWPREFGAAVNLARKSIEAVRENNKARAYRQG